MEKEKRITSAKKWKWRMYKRHPRHNEKGKILIPHEYCVNRRFPKAKSLIQRVNPLRDQSGWPVQRSRRSRYTDQHSQGPIRLAGVEEWEG